MDMDIVAVNFQNRILRIRTALGELDYDTAEWPYAEDAISKAMEYLAEAVDALGEADHEGDEPNE
jgi:hypothetical protein